VSRTTARRLARIEAALEQTAGADWQTYARRPWVEWPSPALIAFCLWSAAQEEAYRDLPDLARAKAFADAADHDAAFAALSALPGGPGRPDRAAATAELESRGKAKASLRGYVERFSWEPEPAAHHLLLIEKLEEIVSGSLKRLMIFMPPGSAKSYYASIMTPGYALGRNPRWNVIAASHTQELADRWGRKNRNIVGSPEWEGTFGFGLAQDSHAAHRWDTEGGGEYYAAGVGGPITGKRADLIIIDDPIKGHKDAESAVSRETVWQWYLSDLRSRRKPGCRIMLIQTRWHYDDLAGRILPEGYDFRSGPVTARDGEEWHVINLPALADRADDPLGRKVGESLWPGWFGDSYFAQERISQGPRNWASLYQQKPTPDEGGYFERQYFQYYDEPPLHLQIYGASDYAVSEDHGDYTVHLVVGIAPNSDIYLLDLWREQANTLTWVETLFSLVAKHKDRLHVWGEEKDQIEKGVGPFINKFCEERNVYFTRYELSTAGNKELKARSIQARMQQKRVWFPRHAPWLTAFESELLQFPAGVHDDQVDALANIGRILDRMSEGQAPRTAAPQLWPLSGTPDPDRPQCSRIRVEMSEFDKGLGI
jgi:predicted phage terminase large subunit-like protein